MDKDRVHEAADQIVDNGYSVVPMSGAEVDATATVLSEGKLFFEQQTSVKQACAAPDRNSGFRAVGEEYSQTADRPDLNESYSVWGFGSVVTGRSDERLCAALIEWQRLLATFLSQLFPKLRRRVASNGAAQVTELKFANSSCAQLNSYKNARSGDRDFLQDIHEDGHLVTLLVSDGPGLEVSNDPDGQFRPMPASVTDLTLMPGSALTAISAGKFDPLYHRVRNHQLPHRFSLMYFVNPDVSQPLYGWLDVERLHDLAPAIAAKPADFGLPPVPQ